ncbi:MAG: biotin transporter BioY [Lachnospiraceae bacterium]|nr:biotin transporter BioY [Lachnospiraceae bacterium]
MSEVTEVKSTKKKFLSIQNMATIAVLTAVTCILAPLSITIPISPVPISLTNLVIYFGLYILGWKKETVSYIIYLLLGLVGLPIFSGGTSGPAKLAGPTGGYLIGFIFMTIIAGIIIDKFPKNMIICLLGMILGTAVCYAFGTVWLAISAHMTAQAALAAGVLPFIPGDLIKMILAMMIGPQIRKALIRADLF